MNWLLEYVRLIIGLIEKIPPAFWGIIIGSFFSLGGVVLTNRANYQRLREQFTHDRELRIKDRDLALRKEVYLAAAEAVSAGFVAVGKFSNLDVPNEKVTEGYLEKAPAIAKVQIIANEETARAVASVANELGAVYLKLFTKRIPLNVLKMRITIMDNQIASFGKERDRMLELMTQHNLELSTDQRRFDAIKQKFDFEQKRVYEALEQRKGLQGQLTAGQLDISNMCVEESIRLNQLLVPAIIAVRKELELPIDEESYLRMVQDSSATQRTNMNGFLEEVRTLIVTESGGTSPDRV